jgi:IMP dehydrogenase
MDKSKVQFFKSLSDQGLALTYDDVRLRTRQSSVSTIDINLESRFSRNVGLKVPIVSAAMDTVTTSNMAIVMAKLGGIGVIHAGLSIEDQKNEVRRVKLYLNGLIEKPVTVNQSQTIATVISLCAENRFEFRTFPVVNDNNKLVGLLTQNDFDFCRDTSFTVQKAMTPIESIISAPANTTVKQAFNLMRDNKKKTLPLLNKDGTIGGMYILSDVLRITRDNPEHYNIDANGRLRTAAAVPTDPEEAEERISSMLNYLDVAVIDTAQGDSIYALKTLKHLKKKFPKLDVVVGNISEGESARALAKAGADGIKVGQGPGSICSTRPETGIGCPQVTAVFECAKAVEEFGIPVCADGGLSHPGDISIAIAAGAHCVMMGSMLSATKETPGDVVGLEDGTMVKLYRGMGSPSALKDSAASRKRYGIVGSGKPLAEGVESYVPYKGSVVEIMDHYTKALRKSMSYCGSRDIGTHRKEVGFWRITNAGLKESHPHDVKVINT